MDGECNSLRRFEPKEGQWKFWCYVDPDEDCGDTEDGWSFKACSNGSKLKIVGGTFNDVTIFQAVHMATVFSIILMKKQQTYSLTNVMMQMTMTGQYQRRQQTVMKLLL